MNWKACDLNLEDELTYQQQGVLQDDAIHFIVQEGLSQNGVIL